MTTNGIDLTTNGAALQAKESARAALFYFLSRAFALPAEMLEADAKQLADLIPELPRQYQPLVRSFVDTREDAKNDLEELALAHARLFLGPFEIVSPPYASIYLEPDQKLMGEVSAAVAREYAESGLGRGSGPHEAPDHIGLEWEYMYYLTHRFLSTSEGDWLKKRKRFFYEHMQKWVPKFSMLIIDREIHPFYTALAKLQLELTRKQEIVFLD